MRLPAKTDKHHAMRMGEACKMLQGWSPEFAIAMRDVLNALPGGEQKVRIPRCQAAVPRPAKEYYSGDVPPDMNPSDMVADQCKRAANTNDGRFCAQHSDLTSPQPHSLISDPELWIER